MADNFTDQVYKRAQEIVTAQKFEGDWQKFMNDTVRVSGLLADSGLSATHADGLEKLRRKLDDSAKADGKSAAGIGDVIIAAARPGSPARDWVQRAATLKMLKHLYRQEKRGGQDVWIYSPPKEYGKWIYAEVSGNEASVKTILGKEEEIYSEEDKKTMCSALKIALQCSQKTEELLSKKADSTLAAVKRWFGSKDDEVDEDVKTLLAGFKRITNLCNSNTLIFPDDPNDRKSMTKYDKLYGSVWPGGEGKFPVIYLAGAFKKAGNSGKLWLCAQTILHEASHLEVSTEDHRYDTRGLKPSGLFPHAKAMQNADSWGYFSIDLCGYLSESDRQTVLK